LCAAAKSADICRAAFYRQQDRRDLLGSRDPRTRHPAGLTAAGAPGMCQAAVEVGVGKKRGRNRALALALRLSQDGVMRKRATAKVRNQALRASKTPGKRCVL